jgi:hypothetical protein
VDIADMINVGLKNMYDQLEMRLITAESKGGKYYSGFHEGFLVGLASGGFTALEHGRDASSDEIRKAMAALSREIRTTYLIANGGVEDI